MTQNRNKLLDLLMGNLATVVVHKVLQETAEEASLKKYYSGEVSNSFELAMHYRAKINPINEPLLEKDALEIKAKVISKAEGELRLRIARGYQNIDLESVEKATNELLFDLKITSSS